MNDRLPETLEHNILERIIEKYARAIDDMEQWGSYASDYFKNKYQLDRNLREMREFLEWLKAQK